MRILIVGGTGVIGRAVVAALSGGNELVVVTRHSSPISVDYADPASIRKMYDAVGQVDAMINLAGGAAFKPLPELTDADFDLSLRNKLMGQVNLARYGVAHVRDGGSFTLTSGVLSRVPMPGSSPVSLVNAGLEGFARAAALEMPRGIRINVVSPPWVKETREALGWDASKGMPAAQVAQAYVRAVTGSENGAVIEPG
jgi:NAD(P)-dependent dehydrogenase (short-subunit alcohol dehydrogenase family)